MKRHIIYLITFLLFFTNCNSKQSTQEPQNIVFNKDLVEIETKQKVSVVGSLKAQEISIDGVLINPNELSILGEPKSLNDNDSIFKLNAFISPDLNYIALEKKEKQYKGDSIISGYSGKSTFKLFLIDGTQVWQKVFFDCTVIQCFISKNMEYVSLLIISNFEKKEMSELRIYNKKGELLHTDFNVNYLYPNLNGKVLVFKKDTDYSGNQENYKKVFILNLNEKLETIELLFEKGIHVYGVSGNGKSIICNMGKSADSEYCTFFSYSNAGKLIWKKEFSGYPGWGSVSENGNYFIRIPKYGQFELHDNTNGDLILKKDGSIIDGKQEVIRLSSFTPRDLDKFVILSGVGPLKSRIVLYDIKGNQLKETVIEGKRCKRLSVETHDSNHYIYFDGLKVGEL